MERNNNKNKIIMLIILLTLVIMGIIGITYAAYKYQVEGDTSELITGDIYMHYKGVNKGINIVNGIPSENYNKNNYFEFTIDGKNTYTEKDIWYEIDLVHGDEPEGRNIRIDDKFLRFRLTEKIGTGQERIVRNNLKYDDINNKKIWVNKIAKETDDKIKITYKLYMWISYDVLIGYDDENEIEFDYSNDDWVNNVYASVKINVKGDFNEKTKDDPKPEEVILPTNMIKGLKTLAYRSEKELIAIDVTDKNNIMKCENIETCVFEGRKIEYRYSGPQVNNYIYLKDNDNRNELWRIIGIFEDEDTEESYIKLVKNSPLYSGTFPSDFWFSGTRYILLDTYLPDIRTRLFYTKGGSKNTNDWSIAGLQYWLNNEKLENSINGYLYFLSAETKELLINSKYYLGTSKYDTDTTIQSYNHERDIKNCLNNKSTSDNQDGCYVWSGNAATWTGMVGLMYPSDFGFSMSSEYWQNTALYNTRNLDLRNISWIFGTMSQADREGIWLINPSSSSATSLCFWNSQYAVTPQGTYNYWGFLSTKSPDYLGSSAYPVISLSSSTTWLSGDGSKENPYKVLAD